MSLPTPAQFAALVTDLVPALKDATREEFEAWTSRPRQADPPAFGHKRWTRELVNAGQAMALCRLRPKTWQIYRDRARRAAQDSRTDLTLLPPPTEGGWADGLWETGTLAIYKAVVDSRVLAKAPRREPREDWYPLVHKEYADPRGCRSNRDFARRWPQHNRNWWGATITAAGYPARTQVAPDADLLPIARKLLARPGVPPRPADLIEAASAEGYEVSDRTARRVLTRASGEALTLPEPDTNDGLVRPATLAQYAGVGVNAVIRAMSKCWYCGGPPEDPWHGDGYRAARGEPTPHSFAAWLTPRRRDQWGWLLDPARVKKAGGLRTPVDAELLPGQRNMYRPTKLGRERR